MKIEDFRNHIQDLVEDLQLKVWVGTTSKYNSRPNISYRELIIEPFNMPLYSDLSCSINVNVNFWIAIKRDIDVGAFSLEYGDDAVFIDKMILLANNFFEVLNYSPYIRIMARENDIQTYYFESDSNVTINSQSLLRFTLPLKIYGLR